MSGDDDFQGTGDLIADLGVIKIYDDGDNDSFISKVYEYNGREYGALRNLRQSLGDKKFKEALEGSKPSGSTVDASDFEPREPVAFKCDRCNRTYPRTMKARDGVCDDCA